MSYAGEEWSPPPNQKSYSEGKKVKLSPVCTKCRSKHLKCDGGPVCSRCQNSGSKCIFVPSRRGMRPSRVNSPSPGLLEQPPPLAYSTQQLYPQQLPTTSHAPTTSWLLGMPQALLIETAPLFPTDLSVSSLSRQDSLNLIQNFYILSRYAHQFVLPQDVLLQRHNEADIQPLQAVIEYLGSTSLLTSQPADIRHHAESLCFATHVPQNAYTVQAQLLLGLHLSGINDHQRAVQLLQRGRMVASSIGMNHPDFWLAYSPGSESVGRSWQMTWQTLTQYCNAWIPESNKAATRMLSRPRVQRDNSATALQQTPPYPTQLPEWAMLPSQTTVPNVGWPSTSFAPVTSAEIPQSNTRHSEHKEY